MLPLCLTPSQHSLQTDKNLSFLFFHQENRSERRSIAWVKSLRKLWTKRTMIHRNSSPVRHISFPWLQRVKRISDFITGSWAEQLMLVTLSQRSNTVKCSHHEYRCSVDLSVQWVGKLWTALVKLLMHTHTNTHTEMAIRQRRRVSRINNNISYNTLTTSAASQRTAHYCTCVQHSVWNCFHTHTAT